MFHSGTNNAASNKATVPIRATALGIVNVMVIMNLLIILNFGLGSGEFLTYFLIICALAITVVHMPLVLLLTVKSNEKKMSEPGPISTLVPPSGLQFLGESLNTEASVAGPERKFE